MKLKKFVYLLSMVILFQFIRLIDAEVQKIDPETANKAEAYYRYAYAHYLEVNDDLEGALKYYKTALEKDPKSADIKIGVANIYHARQQDKEALQIIEEILKDNPDNTTALNEYAQTCYDIASSSKDNSYLEKSVIALEKLKNLQPQQASVYAHLGKLYSLLGKNEKAVKSLTEYIKLQPGSFSAYESLAEIYEQNKDYKAAADVYAPLIEKGILDADLIIKILSLYQKLNDVSMVDALFQKSKDFLNDEAVLIAFAGAYVSMDKSDKAESIYAILYKNNPGDTKLVGDYVDVMEKNQGTLEAADFLENHLKMYGQSLVLGYQLALLYEQVNQWDKSEKIIQNLIDTAEKNKMSINSDDAGMMKTLYVQLGFINQQKRKFKEAIEYYKKAEEFSQLDPKIEFMFAYSYFQDKQYDKAIEALDKGEIKSDDKATFEILRAQIFDAKGEHSQAIKLLKELFAKDSTNTKYLFALAQIYEQIKDYPSAEKLLLAYVQKNDKDEHIYFMLGAINERQKKYKDAEGYFKKALSLKPDYADALNYLGFMLVDRGERLNESMKYIEKALELDKDNGAYLDSLGWGYYKLNKLDLAAEYLKKATLIYPENAVIYDHLGDVYFKQGKFKEAVTQWELALKNKNDEIDAEQVNKKIKDASATRK